jgi:quercetin 2,3-dioxygenase
MIEHELKQEIMSIKRKLTKIYTPPSHPGFLGKGHFARPVIQLDFSESDPFIMLMDDILVKNDHVPVGGPHPHAGFETVSLLLEGEIGDGEHGMHAGDFEIMTAGSGVVHTETISKPTKMRLFQLWLNLPKSERRALPRIQKLSSDHVPKFSQDGVSLRVYSGSFASLTSPIKNHTPLIVADIRMKAHSTLIEQIPANYNTFLYVVGGRMEVGDEAKLLSKNEVGWLDLHRQPESSQLFLKALNEDAHVVLYAAEPQHHEIVSHGPFIGDTMEDIRQLYADFQLGKMEHITEVSADQKPVF